MRRDDSRDERRVQVDDRRSERRGDDRIESGKQPPPVRPATKPSDLKRTTSPAPIVTRKDEVKALPA